MVAQHTIYTLPLTQHTTTIFSHNNDPPLLLLVHNQKGTKKKKKEKREERPSPMRTKNSGGNLKPVYAARKWVVKWTQMTAQTERM